MPATESSSTGKGAGRPNIALTVGSKVRVFSAGPEEEGLQSTGTFRGLVSIGGDNVLAIELAEPDEMKGRVRLVSTAALWAVDILEAAKVEEERRTEKPAMTPGYFG